MSALLCIALLHRRCCLLFKKVLRFIILHTVLKFCVCVCVWTIDARNCKSYIICQRPAIRYSHLRTRNELVFLIAKHVRKGRRAADTRKHGKPIYQIQISHCQRNRETYSIKTMTNFSAQRTLRILVFYPIILVCFFFPFLFSFYSFYFYKFVQLVCDVVELKTTTTTNCTRFRSVWHYLPCKRSAKGARRADRITTGQNHWLDVILFVYSNWNCFWKSL